MTKIVLSRGYDHLTSVSNCFIDHYMTLANEAQIKIYLYLLRAIGANMPVTVQTMADRFNYTEKDIIRALNYWSRSGLLSISYDKSGEISGICLCEVRPPASADTLVLPSETVPVAPSESTAPGKSEEVPSATPFYTKDKLESFKSREDIQQLVYITEQYMGRLLQTNDLHTLLFISDELHFNIELIQYLIEYCMEAGKNNMRYIEKTAILWAEEGITTLEAAKSKGHGTPYTKEAYAVLKAFGIRRNILDTDIVYVTKWIEEYKCSLELIIEACNRTISTIANPSYNYADSILKKWHKNNITTIADVKNSDISYSNEKMCRQQAQARTQTPAAPKPNRFINFKQREGIDYDALADKLSENRN